MRDCLHIVLSMAQCVCICLCTQTYRQIGVHTPTHPLALPQFGEPQRTTAVVLWVLTTLSLNLSFRGQEAATKWFRKDAIKAEVWVERSKDWFKSMPSHIPAYVENS